jgi:hypothetical protein
MRVVSMSDKEFSRLDVLLGLEAGRLTIRDEGERMSLRRRQVFGLVKRPPTHSCRGSWTAAMRGLPRSP